MRREAVPLVSQNTVASSSTVFGLNSFMSSRPADFFSNIMSSAIEFLDMGFNKRYVDGLLFSDGGRNRDERCKQRPISFDETTS